MAPGRPTLPTPARASSSRASSSRSLLALLAGTAMLIACAKGADTSGGVDAGNPNPVDASAPDAQAPACEAEPCFAGVECAETPGGFACGACPAGTEGDGIDCVDIDGCEGSPCFLGVVCTDFPAPDEGFECGDCPDGFFGNGVVCTDINGCEGDPCFEGVACVDNAPPEDGFTCGTCPTGLEGDGLSCTEIDGCAGTPCADGVLCTDNPAPQTGFECGGCPPGNTGDGITCTLLCDPTASLTCGGQVSASNDGAGSTDQVDSWECSIFTLSGPEIIYSFVAPASGIATAELTGLSGDLDLLVIEDSSVGGLCDPEDATVCVPGGSSSSSGTSDERARWDAVAGTTYYIIVDGFSGATSSFTLKVETDTEDILLNEVSYGVTDFVEIMNHGACTADIGGLSLTHRASLTDTPHSFTFPNGTDVAPGNVVRWVESSGSPFLAGELDAGESILDIPADPGFTALCNGSCDTSGCTNLLDYVERDDDTADAEAPGGPSCAGFSPGPIDAAGQSGEASLNRISKGSTGNFQAGNWSFGATTRD